jgi:branched-subunit amino acid ABC-type transport system permease component
MALDIVAPAVTGAIQGCVYGLLGLGLVLLYKSNKVFNFAQAEFGTCAAFGALFAVTARASCPRCRSPWPSCSGCWSASASR